MSANHVDPDLGSEIWSAFPPCADRRGQAQRLVVGDERIATSLPGRARSWLRDGLRSAVEMEDALLRHQHQSSSSASAPRGE
jgi:hypothetical protein